jgi:hypothetical protein
VNLFRFLAEELHLKIINRAGLSDVQNGWAAQVLQCREPHPLEAHATST